MMSYINHPYKLLEDDYKVWRHSAWKKENLILSIARGIKKKLFETYFLHGKEIQFIINEMTF